MRCGNLHFGILLSRPFWSPSHWPHSSQESTHAIVKCEGYACKAWACIWQREEISDGHRRTVWKNMWTEESLHSEQSHGAGSLSILLDHRALSMCSLVIRKGSKDLLMQISLKEKEGISSWKATLKRDFWRPQLADNKGLWENGSGIGKLRGPWGRCGNLSSQRCQNPGLSVSTTCSLDLCAGPLWQNATVAAILIPPHAHVTTVLPLSFSAQPCDLLRPMAF